MKKNLILLFALSLGLISLNACKIEGCTDPDASNYNKKAKKDDGSCVFDSGLVSYELNEDITTTTTIEEGVIRVVGDISISSDVTVMPGATFIMEEGSSIEVKSSGSLNCTGTPSKPITFKGKVETKGFWAGIAFKSNNTNNKMIYTTVKDAGTYWAWEYANVFVANSSQLAVKNSTFSNSANVGLYFNQTATISDFSNNTFSNNDIVGISLPVRLIGKIDSSSDYNSNNGVNFIYVRGGTGASDHINQQTVWPATTTPCLVIDEVIVGGGLTLSEGTNIVMESGSGFDIRSTGYFSSNGTASNRVNIRGKSSAPGYWTGIRISSSSIENKIVNTNIYDGGSYWANEYSNIYVEGRVEIDNSSVSNANSWGIYVKSSASLYSNGTIQTQAAGVSQTNNLTGNGMGANSSCTDGCTVYFQ